MARSTDGAMLSGRDVAGKSTGSLGSGVAGSLASEQLSLTFAADDSFILPSRRLARVDVAPDGTSLWISLVVRLIARLPVLLVSRLPLLLTDRLPHAAFDFSCLVCDLVIGVPLRSISSAESS